MMDDDEIKKQITPENFVKYKDIEKPDILRDFKISMATDEVARMEGIEVPSFQVDEQLENIKKEMEGQELGDETQIRAKIESTIMRRMVFDFLAEKAILKVNYEDEQEFDENMLEEIAAQSLEREEEMAASAAPADTTEGKTIEVDAEEVNAKAEAEVAEAKAKAEAAKAEAAKAEAAKAEAAKANAAKAEAAKAEAAKAEAAKAEAVKAEAAKAEAAKAEAVKAE